MPNETFNPIKLTVDIEKTTTTFEPVVTQNTDVYFIVIVNKNGVAVTLPDGMAFTLTTSNLYKQSFVTPKPGIKQNGNEILFKLGSNQVEVTGRVDASVQFIDAEGRMDSLPFSYEVKKDLTLGSVQSVNEQTLIELVLVEGPAAIQNAKAVAEEALLQAAQASVGSDATIYPTLKARLDAEQNKVTTQLADMAINAKSYGLDENATWEVNRDAIQASNDFVASNGGGRVLIPQGEYLAKGVIQDSHVTFDIQGTLIHPDGLTPHLISNRVYQTTGTIAKGSSVLTVASAAGIERGTLIGVRGARGISPLQNTTIVNAIDSTQTTGIILTSISGVPTFGQYLVIDDEVINFTGLIGSELTGVTRGVFSTTPTTHLANSIVGTAVRLIGEVINVSGTTITLDRNAVIGVTDASVSYGIVKPKIFGNLKGNKDTVTYRDITAVRWEMVRYGEAKYTAENLDSAIFMTRNTSDCDVDIRAIDCSTKSQSIGACVWLFQGAFRNKVNLHATGDLWSGLYIDNRTSIGGEWDETIDDNYGDITVKSEGYSSTVTTTGLLVVGGNGNRFNINTKNIHTGFSLKNADQVYTNDGSLPKTRNNRINFNIEKGYQPHVVYAEGNIISGFHDTQTNGIFYAGNVKLGVSDGAGNNPIPMRFGDGSYTKPAISFDSEPSTGFYKIGTGQVQFVSLNALVVRMINTGLLMGEGKNLAFGGITGSKIGTSAIDKIGFWGQTPVIRPTGTPVAANDLATALTLLNYIRTQMITMGLIQS